MMNDDTFKLSYLQALNDDAIVKRLQEVLLGGFKQMLDTMSAQIIATLKDEIRQRDVTILNLKKEIKSLQVKSDDMEQWTRRGSMRIHGIPIDTEGSLDDKLLTLFNTKLKMKPPIQLEEIEVAHRLPQGRPTGRPPPEAASPQVDGDGAAITTASAKRPPVVILKFLSRRTKERVMAMRTDLKDIKEENHPAIYFQDDLTAKRAKLSYEARQMKRQNLIIDTWVGNSKIYIKDRHSRIHVIKDQDDLDQYSQ